MPRCHVCGSDDIEPLEQKRAAFRLVSSDVQAVVGSAEFALCRRCLAVQKAITPAWRAMVERIYAEYDINHQSEGVEPTIFDSNKGSGPRSMILLQNFLDQVALPERGRLLDIGCSNGNLLKSFHSFRPEWKLSGAELVDRWKETVLRLPGVEAFYSGTHPQYAGKFDVISLSHVLEHIADPIPFLRSVADSLTENGRILLALPNLRQNSADLVIADHCSHFDATSLSYVIREAGFHTELLSDSLLPKELVAVLSVRPGASSAATGDPPTPATWQAARDRCLYFFSLLDEVRRSARAGRMEGRPFGVMGSSIAACWTTLELEGEVDFLVDEDPNRVGRRLMGLPIVAPGDVPPGGVVFIPMSAAVARKIIGRWQDRPIRFSYVENNHPV